MHKQPQTFLQLSSRLLHPNPPPSSQHPQQPSNRSQPLLLPHPEQKLIQKVLNLSHGTLPVIFNTRTLTLLLPHKFIHYSVAFTSQPVRKPHLIELYEKQVEKCKIEITYVLVTENHILVANNFGGILMLPEDKARKVHAGEVTHMSYRGGFVLTCSADCTAFVLEERTLRMKFMLKDVKYMKEPLLKGHFIDDFRVAVASKLFVKVYSLQHHAFRVGQTIFHVQLPNICTLHFHNDLLFYNTQSNLRVVLLQKLIVTDKKQTQMVASLDLRGQRVDCFCLLQDGLLAIYDSSVREVKGVRVEDGEVLWRKDLEQRGLKKQIVLMEYMGGYLYVMDEQQVCLRVKMERGAGNRGNRGGSKVVVVRQEEVEDD